MMFAQQAHHHQQRTPPAHQLHHPGQQQHQPQFCIQQQQLQQPQQQGESLEHRIRTLVAQLLGENEGFFRMVKMLEGFQSQSPPDPQALVEIRTAMRSTLQVTRRLETECSKCMEACRASASPPMSPSSAHAAGSGGSSSSLAAEPASKKRKSEGKAGPAKAIRLQHIRRAPEPNDQAAACPDGGDWILTRVVSFNDITEQVVVIDEDDSRQRQYILQRSQVMLLPRATPKEAQGRFYHIGAKALALYPSSTTLYPAVVVDNGIKKDGEAYCRMQFEDDDDEMGQPRTQEVLARMITELPGNS